MARRAAGSTGSGPTHRAGRPANRVEHRRRLADIDLALAPARRVAVVQPA